jgi:predicted Zn-dependent protease
MTIFTPRQPSEVSGCLNALLLAGAIGMATILSAQETTTAAPAIKPSGVTGVTPPAQNAELADVARLIARGSNAEALAQLDRLRSLSPPPRGIDRLRGMALYAQGSLIAADQAFAKAIEHDAEDRQAIQMRGITLFRIGRPAAAIPLLESMQSSSGGKPTGPGSAPVDPSYVLALCYLDTRRYDDARKAFALQFSFPPDSAAAYLLGARMLLRHEYIPVAQQFAHKALELAPTLTGAHELLGEAELAGNHLDEAIHEFKAEAALNPLAPSVYDRLGDAYIRRGDFALAQQSLQEAVLLDPSATGPFILLGKVFLKQNNPAAALGYLEHARQMDDRNFITHSLLGQAYRQMGRPDDAHRETAIGQKLQAAAAPDFQHEKK